MQDVDDFSNTLKPDDIGDSFSAIKTPGDGNCLYHAASIAVYDSLQESSRLRKETSEELLSNPAKYAYHPELKRAASSGNSFTNNEDTLFLTILCDEASKEFTDSGNRIQAVICEAKITSRERTRCGLLSILALCNVLKTNIYSCYPQESVASSSEKTGSVRNLLHNCFKT